jgi:hypothetical protein
LTLLGIQAAPSHAAEGWWKVTADVAGLLIVHVFGDRLSPEFTTPSEEEGPDGMGRCGDA